jgi:antagonist of KipI
MADRQTTGGYVKIATVISVDLPLIAQALPGSKIRFEAMGLEEAQELIIEQEKRITEWVGSVK